jgi:hypothetical protein
LTLQLLAVALHELLPQQNEKSWFSQVAAHLPASQYVSFVQEAFPLQKTPASPAPLSSEPRVHVVSPVHCTIDVPSERAETGTFRQSLCAMHPISHSVVATQLTPFEHESLPTSPPTPHRMVQLSALQATGSPVHVPSPVHAIVHAPASQVTPCVHAPSPPHWIWQARPLHSTGLVVQAP